MHAYLFFFFFFLPFLAFLALLCLPPSSSVAQWKSKRRVACVVSPILHISRTELHYLTYISHILCAKSEQIFPRCVVFISVLPKLDQARLVLSLSSTHTEERPPDAFPAGSGRGSSCATLALLRRILFLSERPLKRWHDSSLWLILQHPLAAWRRHEAPCQ